MDKSDNIIGLKPQPQPPHPAPPQLPNHQTPSPPGTQPCSKLPKLLTFHVIHLNTSCILEESKHNVRLS